MSLSELNEPDYNRFLSKSERQAKAEAVKANAKFVRAMARATRRGRENAHAGTFVDVSPPIGAKRIYGDVALSPCGSPAAMCVASGGEHGGAGTLK